MTDEHPNERLVTPSEDGGGFDRSLVSRRSMLGGSALLAGLLAYTSDPTDPQLPGRASGSAAGIARASDNPDEPLIILGPESDPVGYLFQDAAGGIILQDATSGNHFWYNQAQGRWETDAELDVPTLTATTTTTEQIGDGRHYAGAYSGADPDARLSNAISAASAGDVIYLENATYDSSLSISKVLSLIGVGQTGTPIEASWTATTGSCAFIGITLGTGGSINLDGIACHAERIYGQGATTVTAGGDRVGIYDSYNIDVTFDNGTSEGMADGLRGSSTVTDNGTNTAGDVT